MEEEKWVPLPGYEGRYEISSYGRVFSLVRGIFLKPSPDKDGYWRVAPRPSIEGKPYYQKVHRLVAEAFIGSEPFPGAMVLHGDGDVNNNCVSNLRWGTAKENAEDMRKHGTNPAWNMTHCRRGHEFTEENTSLRPNGKRRCLACARGYRSRVPEERKLELAALRNERRRKRYAEDPEYRAKAIASVKSNYARRNVARNKKYAEDPEYRAAILRKAKERTARKKVRSEERGE